MFIAKIICSAIGVPIKTVAPRFGTEDKGHDTFIYSDLEEIDELI